MKKIILAEYQGRQDINGKAVGHGPKVLGDYAGLIKDEYELTILAPRCILKAASSDGRRGSKVLPHSIVMKSGNSLFEKIFNKIKMFANINIVLKSDAAETVWFFNTEFYLMLYLALFGNKNKNIICTLFMENFGSGLRGALKQRIFEAAQKRMSLIISTGPGFCFKNVPYVFIPDYYCDEEEYAPYRKAVRKRQAVCLGTMGAEKQLEELVESFKRIGYPLVIAGRFYDKERLLRLNESAADNITIRDEYLSREEYLTLLGESSFVVLPYSAAQYATQTSGVLQEAVFMDTVAIAHKAVLEGNRIAGIAYDELKYLDKDLLEKDTAGCRKEYTRLRKELYSKEAMAKELCKNLSL